MKRVLFLLGAFAAMSLVGCNGTKDCACDIYDVDGIVSVSSTDAGVNGSLDVLEFDGECTDVTWANLPVTSHAWSEMAVEGYTLKCSEK